MQKKIKKSFAVILSLLMIVTMLPMAVMSASAAVAPTPYDGVPVEPLKISQSNYKKLGLTDNNWSQFKGYYAIRDAKELYGFAVLVSTVIQTKNYNAVLLQDIVVNANGGNKYDWTPINAAGSYTDYEGIFDGNGHYISGIYSTITENYYGKLICGFVANLKGTVKNLIIKDSTFAPSELFATYDGLGTITGYPFDCVIENCRVENVNLTVRNNEGQIGGIAGFGNGNNSTIKNCVSIGVTISGGAITDPVSCYAPYSKCYTSADAEHTCADISVQHKTVLATCAYPGRSNYKYCLVCGDVTSGTKTETPATGHNWNAATCTAPKTCQTCDLTEGDVLQHTWSEFEADNGNEHSRKCVVCGAIGSKENHSWVNRKCEICDYECTHGTDDDWVFNQSLHYRVCIYNCGEQYDIGEHSWENGSCAVCGYDCIHSYDKDSQTYRCITCNMMCPHRYYNRVCTDCGMECLEHNFDSGICTECGYYCEHEWNHNKYQYYSVCNYCDLLCGHSYHEAYRKEATCSGQGLVSYSCAYCTSVKNEILETLEHDYTWTYNDTTHEGYCNVGKETKTGFHNYSREYFDPTCTEDGYYADTCTDCGYTKKTITSPKLNHYGGEATCEELAVCERCGEGYGEYGDHIGGEATCTNPAICEVCGEGYGELKRHEADLDDGDCTTDILCVNCGATVKEGNPNHTWDEDNFCSNPYCYETKGFTFTFTYGDEVLFVRNVHGGNFYTFEDFEERDGLTLVGWVADEDADEDGEPDFYPIGDYTYVEGDLSFNAVYKLVYTVHFITYDIWENRYTESFNPIMGEANQTVTLWDDFSPYYKFLGWAMEEGGEVVYEANEELTLTRNLTLYGVIRPYRATFELGEGAVWNDENGEPITVLEGDYSGSWIEIRQFPTRTGYIFKGFVDQTDWFWEPWQDEDTGEWVVDFYFDMSDRTMTAVWEECTDHVYDDANDEDCNICGASKHDHVTEKAENKATCSKKAVCEKCGNEYGEFDSDVHDWSKSNGICANGCGTKAFEAKNGAVLDTTNRIIYGLDAGITSVDSYFGILVDGAEWEYELGIFDRFGTGTKAILVNDDDFVAEYTLLIYGDVDGDGWYDGQDAIIVDCLGKGMLTKDDVSEAVYMAADCNHDGVIDQLDVYLLNQAGALLANVDQSKPAEVLLETSSEYVEYISLIDQSPEIEVEDETDAPATDAEDSEPIEENSIFTFIFDLFAILKNFFNFIFSFINI